MAEEAKPEVAVEQEAATTDDKGGKTFEERLAELKKPEAVPQPKEEEVNAQLSQLNSQTTTWEKRLTDIKSAIEKANALRDGGRSESKGIVDQLKAVRARIKAASSEREDAFQQLREITQARQAQQKNLQDLRRSLKFEDIAQVEQRVRELENQISHGQCANLAEEKRVMVEIKQLNATKGLITQYQAQRQNQTDDSENKLSLEERRAEATKRLDEAKKEAEKLEKELDLMRAKQDQGAPNVNDLWKEQKELYGKLKDHRATIRTVNVEFKEEVNKFRAFQRELFNYQRGKKKIEAEQRRVEWEKRRSEEDGPVDADVPSDDPLVGHPWIDEILQCQDLEKVLGLLMPKSEAAPVAAPVDTKAPPVAEKGMFIGGKDKGDDDDLFGGLVKKSKSAKKAAAPMKVAAPKAVQLRMDTIVNLGNIGVEIPKTNADLARVVELIKEKKKAFEGMTEEDKKKAKAAKSGAKAKESKPVPASAEKSLVSVSIVAKGADKVQVKLDYPALSPSA
mmetsp:Transcript_36869/g.54105  ORF Transcript_36869/g.54105 Transcript_36869/m.54105 type:complete len:508 (+) Transcript_36869:59-1582(+)|eukprot:CAMPEP_0179435784 /NCGR_PEP_ID=MMETSP0799-20121207/19841_1 /TAXON_ID=46947 /ORGANISM="Geminigera cryophila, Strain CCMP2564" /LENGTH=507 /DNA_ID=CAMNT_0021215395 /DNA_START=62 /DNA_END=1585 /DNA_ORIENTATION=+